MTPEEIRRLGTQMQEGKLDAYFVLGREALAQFAEFVQAYKKQEEPSTFDRIFGKGRH
jgi:hypothetical protein